MTPFCVVVGGEDVMEVFWVNLVHDLEGDNCSAEFSPIREGSPSKFCPEGKRPSTRWFA